MMACMQQFEGVLGNAGDGSRARLVWLLEVRRPALRMAAVVGRPVLQWGHDWVVANGVEQFRNAVTAER